MKKNIFVILALLSFSIGSYSQSEISAMRLGVGARGGVVFPYGAKYTFNQTIGGEGLLDVQYSMYWHKNTTNLGFLTGITFGYQQTGLTEDIRYYQMVSFTDCGTIFYNNGAQDIVEKKHRIDFEIPVMLALKDDNGVFFNFGPRLAIPVWTSSQVQLSSPNIQANFVEEGVWVKNEQVIGKTNETSFKANWNAPVMTLKIGAELGYEFTMKNDDAIDLGLYIDWAAYSFYKTKANTDLLQVIAPSNQAPASVVINSPSDKVANQLGSVNLGIKFAYHFNLLK